MRKEISGTIHISTVYTSAFMSYPYIKIFLADYPESAWNRRCDMVWDILNNSIDLGLIAYPEKNKQLVLSFHDDALVLVASPEHPFAKKSTSISPNKRPKMHRL